MRRGRFGAAWAAAVRAVPADGSEKAPMRAILPRLTRRPNCTLAAIGVSFAAVIVVLFLADLESRHRDAIAAAKQSARNFAEVLAEHTARTFEGVDRALSEAEPVRRNNEPGEAAPAQEPLHR